MSLFAKPSSSPLGALASVCRQCRFRPTHEQLRLKQQQQQQTTRTYATAPLTNIASSSSSDNATAPPRWARTPQAMRAPHRVRPKNDNDEYAVNEDPITLDAAYVKMLGSEGDTLLPDEIKWLAVTHKSFDHGRRGYNDRLAFLGKRIIDLQTSLALLNAPTTFSAAEINSATASSSSPSSPPSSTTPASEDIYGRHPFTHPSLANLENITALRRETLLDKRRLAQLAERYGLGKVVRWKPRQVGRLASSGLDVVLTQTLYAIIGAVSLQKGGEVATRTARERILAPLGIV